MKIHPSIVAAVLASLLGLQAWTLKTCADLRADVRVLCAKLEMHVASHKTELATRFSP